MLAEILSHLRALAREREVPTELIKRPKERGRISFVVDEVTSPCGRQLGAVTGLSLPRSVISAQSSGW